MTNAEKIIADLIDQRKINGSDAIILIKSLSREDGTSNLIAKDIWKGQYPNPNTVLYNNLSNDGNNLCQNITRSSVSTEY